MGRTGGQSKTPHHQHDSDKWYDRVPRREQRKEECVFASFCSLSPWNIFGAQYTVHVKLHVIKTNQKEKWLWISFRLFSAVLLLGGLEDVNDTVSIQGTALFYMASIFLSAPASIITGHSTDLDAHLFRLMVQLWAILQTTILFFLNQWVGYVLQMHVCLP